MRLVVDVTYSNEPLIIIFFLLGSFRVNEASYLMRCIVNFLQAENDALFLAWTSDGLSSEFVDIRRSVASGLESASRLKGDLQAVKEIRSSDLYELTLGGCKILGTRRRC